MNKLDKFIDGEEVELETYEYTDENAGKDIDFGEIEYRLGHLPFNLWDSTTMQWRKKRAKLRSLCDMTAGRPANVFDKNREENELTTQINRGISMYDEYQCELLYRWFNPQKLPTIDPFCGGPCRGIIANMLGITYKGFDVRKEQIEANYEQLAIIKANNPSILTDAPLEWVHDDIRDYQGRPSESYGFAHTSPPFPFVEYYSSQVDDLSALRDAPDGLQRFVKEYTEIMRYTASLLRTNSNFAVDIGDGRCEGGYYPLFTEQQAIIMRDLGFACKNRIFVRKNGYSLRNFALARKFGTNTSGDHALVNVVGQCFVFRKK